MRGMVKVVTWNKIAQLWLYSKRTRMHDREPTVMSTLSLPISWSLPQQTEQNGTRQRHEMIDRSQMAVCSVHVPVESLKGPPARCGQPLPNKLTEDDRLAHRQIGRSKHKPHMPLGARSQP
jgi:hypothetical protein